ncbi:MAG: DNA internalization-related competence protein ComEC/Rec2 [Clostridia bacterium]|nr:DNA internalization-related competence protein ComEC/Rec2 [Clostridia bacterium]
MKRPLVNFVIGFIVGIILSLIKRTILINMVLFFFCAVIVCICMNVVVDAHIGHKNTNLPVLLRTYEFKNALKMVLIVIIFIFCGYFYTNLYTKNHVYTDEVTNITGKVVNVTEKASYVETIVKTKKGKVLLKTQNLLKVGDKVKASVIGKIPEKARNKGNFDYRKYLYSKGIFFVCELKSIEVEEGREPLFYKLRRGLIDKINMRYPKEEASIVNAILLGDKNDLSDEVNEDFTKAGMVHLLVVSGAHIAFFILLVSKILKFLKISKRFHYGILIIFIIAYIIITGASASILRAGMVTILFLISKALKRQNDGITTMFLGAFLLLLFNPYTIYSIGFLLSFSGAFSILLFNKMVYEKISFLPEFLRNTLSIALSVQIFTIPVIIYYFHTLYLAGIVTSIVAVPLTSAILSLGVFSVIPVVGKFIAYANCVLIFTLRKVAEIFAGISFLTFKVSNRALICLLIIYVWFLLKKRYKKYVVILIALCIVITLLPGKLEINTIDVGHGDSIFIVTPNHKTILIDTGDKYISNGKEYDKGSQNVVPYILSKGYKTIDLLILTHMDSDHTGGVGSVLNELNVKKVAIGVNSGNIEELKNVKTVELKSGMKFIVDKIEFSVLLPNENFNVSENNNSVVLKMKSKAITALFTGDLEEEGEKWLLEKGIDVKADLLKVGHHGSNTSSSSEFLKKVSPKIAVISVGNRFNTLPNIEVLQRLKNVGAKVFRTDEIGCVELKFYCD